MLKAKRAVFTVACLSVCLLARPSVMALGISIEIGDRPYYTEGASYWDDGYLWIWVPGHWSRHHHEWIHGHYERTGEFHREHSREHHHHHPHDHDHHDHD